MWTIRATRRRSRSHKAANDTVPGVAPLFWAFRIMVGLGFVFIAVMLYFFWIARASVGQSYPALVADCAVVVDPDALDRGRTGLVRGRVRPPALDGGRRAAHGAVGQPAERVRDLLITLAGFVMFYSILFVIEMGLMLKYIRKGPFQDVEETEAWEARHEHACAP